MEAVLELSHEEIARIYLSVDSNLRVGHLYGLIISKINLLLHTSHMNISKSIIPIYQIIYFIQLWADVAGFLEEKV